MQVIILKERLRGNRRHSLGEKCGRPRVRKVPHPVHPTGGHCHTPSLGRSYPFALLHHPNPLSLEKVCVRNATIRWVSLMGE